MRENPKATHRTVDSNKELPSTAPDAWQMGQAESYLTLFGCLMLCPSP